MKENLRIGEALAYYTSQTGKKIDVELSVTLWPYCDIKTKRANLWRLKTGRTQPNPSQVYTICQMTGVDPNFLYGWK